MCVCFHVPAWVALVIIHGANRPGVIGEGERWLTFSLKGPGFIADTAQLWREPVLLSMIKWQLLIENRTNLILGLCWILSRHRDSKWGFQERNTFRFCAGFAENIWRCNQLCFIWSISQDPIGCLVLVRFTPSTVLYYSLKRKKNFF